MTYKIELSDNFIKEAKKLIKRYSSLRKEIELLAEDLSHNPTKGIFIGADVYKIRLAVSSKNKGKSGGARVLYYLKLDTDTVYLLSIYSKGEVDNISDSKIKELLQSYL